VVRAKEPGTRLGEDPEELHDMRVATRRLRAALDLFEDVLPVRARRSFREELGWLAGVLGAVRDLDVQQEGLADMSKPPPRPGATCSGDGHDPLADLAALLSHASARRPAPTCWPPSTRSAGIAWPTGWPPWCSRDRPALAGHPGARRHRRARLVWPVTTRSVKAAKRAKRSGLAADFHRLRIRGKRLRYSLEFSAELYGGRTTRYTRRAHRAAGPARPHAGRRSGVARLADLATGEAHLPAATVFVMGGVAEQHRRQVARLLRRLPKEISRVGGREWQDLQRHHGGVAPRPSRPAAGPPHAAGGASTARSPNRRHPGLAPALRPWFPSRSRVARSHSALGHLPHQASGNGSVVTHDQVRGCSVSTKCSWSVSRKLPMSCQMSEKSGSAMWAR
jgi:triphosphatase